MNLSEAWLKSYRIMVHNETKRMVNRALAEGQTKPLEMEIWGKVSQSIWLDVGWQPLVESSVEGQSFTKLTMRLDIPALPW